MTIPHAFYKQYSMSVWIADIDAKKAIIINSINENQVL